MTARAEGTRMASVQGVLRGHGPSVRFRGSVKLEARDWGMYYTWSLESHDGEFLASVSRPVAYQVIPPDQEPFGFALDHALEGVRRYRINRVRPFQVETWQWEPA